MLRNNKQKILPTPAFRFKITARSKEEQRKGETKKWDAPVADSVGMDVGQGAEQLVHVQLDICHRDRLKKRERGFFSALFWIHHLGRQPPTDPDPHWNGLEQISFILLSSKCCSYRNNGAPNMLLITSFNSNCTPDHQNSYDFSDPYFSGN